MRKSDSSGPSRGRRGSSRRTSSSSRQEKPYRKPGKGNKSYRQEERPRQEEDYARKKKPYSGDQQQPGKKRAFSRDQEGSGKKAFSGNKDTGKKRTFARYEEGDSRKKKFTKSAPSGSDEQSYSKRGSSAGSDWKKKPYGNKGKGRPYSKKEAAAPTIANLTGKIRLNRYIANSGVCSRREADELIRMGLVSVNGNVITEMGFQVNPGDVVRYEDKILKAEKPVYILLNKPKGYITTTKDPEERNTVMNLIGSAVKERIYPVGRLDRNTTGLLLLTNDGELAEKLSHPSYQAKKIYKVELDKPLTKNDAQKILDGVHLEEGRAVVDDLGIVSEDGKTVGIEIHIGWNRVVRRIFEALGYNVVKLDRSVYAGLDKKDLPRGHWRFLTREEIVRLKHFGKQA